MNTDKDEAGESPVTDDKRDPNANDRATLRDEIGLTKPGSLASHHDKLEKLNQELQNVALATSMDDLDQASEWAREAMRNTSEAIDALVESQTPDGVDASDAIRTWNMLATSEETRFQYHEETWKGLYQWLQRGSEDYIESAVEDYLER